MLLLNFACPLRHVQAELTWFAHPQMVTDPSTNRARRRITSLIETNVLPPSQTATLQEIEIDEGTLQTANE